MTRTRHGIEPLSLRKSVVDDLIYGLALDFNTHFLFFIGICMSESEITLGHLFSIFTFTATCGSNRPNSFQKLLALLYYRHFMHETSFYSPTKLFRFITHAYNYETTIILFFKFFFANLSILCSHIPS